MHIHRRYFRLRMTKYGVQSILLVWNQINDPALSDSEVTQVVESTSKKESAREPNSAERDCDLTGIGNAERLRLRHGNNLRYCHPWKDWLIWNGKRWVIDDRLEVVGLAKETVRSIYRPSRKMKGILKSNGGLETHKTRALPSSSGCWMVACLGKRPASPYQRR